MGLTILRFFRGSFLFSFLLLPLSAAPMLRLVSTTVGPVSIAVGAAGAPQVVETYNAGDGSLNLQASSSVTWAVPSVGALRACTTRAGNCLPVQIALQTASLAKGMYTGVVTVSDPNAVDAPQTITVTVQMDGGVPDRVDLYVAPNGASDDVHFSTNNNLSSNVTTSSGGSWLSMSVEGVGTFNFVIPYRISGRYLNGMAETGYNGSIQITNSSFAPDKKTVPVTLHVTSQPIAQASVKSLQFRVVQDSKKTPQYVVVSNRGLGSLNITALTPSTTSGGNWLSVESAGGSLYKVTVDPAGLALGAYKGSVAFSSNAANGAITVPVDLQIIASGPPWAFFGGGVNIATYQSSEPVGKGDIVALFGEQFSAKDPEVSPTLPLSTQLGGATVFVNDNPVPLYFSSYGQINFQLPYTTPAGTALVRVERDGQRGNTVSLSVADHAAKILPRGVDDYGIVLIYAAGAPYAMPTAKAAQYGLNGRPASVGELLVMFVVGMGPTLPAVTAGEAAPSQPLAWAASVPKVVFGAGSLSPGVSVQPAYAGLVPTLAGLYQINVVVPPGTPSGDQVSVHLEENGVKVSNRVTIAVQ